METPANELRRIRNGPEPDEQAFVVRVHFSADEPDSVIERARDVLGRVTESRGIMTVGTQRHRGGAAQLRKA
ncbi:hypothetical protein QFZ82_005513 [Streptomyces sp. V4I23]|uniref:hypothetical protein n=1 Tax=Streptomyces sp. V4I23 TaxID=3042282 RepID=UPI0027812091|nr:hypothetical protein [Streptomyces sp. V4I23]MDQ1011028.1 hypothetical protein [Streptomyces sp. V4I23]